MGFKSVRVYGVRNLKNCEIFLDAPNVYLVGENGQGKTNFLETLYFLSYAASFRTQRERDLVAWNAEELATEGCFYSEETGSNQIKIIIQKDKKKIVFNGKIINDRKILVGCVTTIVFVHNDFLFAGGPPEKRRWFMDQTLSLYDLVYIDELRRYKRVLRERNFLLKKRDFSMLEHYNQLLAEIGVVIREKRQKIVASFNAIFTPMFKDISGLEEDIHISYRPSWREADTEDVLRLLRSKQEIDFNMGSTGTGAHRDLFVFSTGSRDFARYASTGQQRLLSLTLRATQAQFFTKMTGKKPILLLDDVLLELDPERRRRFRERLPEAEQIFYTFLPDEDSAEKEENSKVFIVKNGELIERRR